jgi:hypothetical protein
LNKKNEKNVQHVLGLVGKVWRQARSKFARTKTNRMFNGTGKKNLHGLKQKQKNTNCRD